MNVPANRTKKINKMNIYVARNLVQSLSNLS